MALAFVFAKNATLANVSKLQRSPSLCVAFPPPPFSRCVSLRMTTMVQSISFKGRDSDHPIMRSLGSGRMEVEQSTSLDTAQPETLPLRRRPNRPYSQIVQLVQRRPPSLRLRLSPPHVAPHPHPRSRRPLSPSPCC